MLRLLIRNVGNVRSKARIRDWVWDYGFSGEMTVVDSSPRYSLRKKVETEPPQLIRTVRDVGYLTESH